MAQEMNPEIDMKFIRRNGGDYTKLMFRTLENNITVNEIKDFCKKMKLDKAMALDGGASTSINYKDVEIYSNTGLQRRVKSFIVVEK